MLKLTKNLYGVITTVALTLSALVFLLFSMAIIIGGSAGSLLAVTAAEIMKLGIYIAAGAMLVGIIDVYIRGAHSLKLGVGAPADDEKFPEPNQNDAPPS